MQPKKKCSNAGFTLIEVLVAMTIFAIASSATASLMFHSTSMDGIEQVTLNDSVHGKTRNIEVWPSGQVQEV